MTDMKWELEKDQCRWTGDRPDSREAAEIINPIIREIKRHSRKEESLKMVLYLGDKELWAFNQLSSEHSYIFTGDKVYYAPVIRVAMRSYFRYA